MKGSRILVVEDDALVAADLGEMLRSFGCVVVGTAATAGEARDLAEASRPDLALMDIHLEGEADGISAAETLRRSLELPVVYVTAHTDAATLERARQTEPLGFIAKPFTERSVATALAVALYRARAERRRREEARQLEARLASLRPKAFDDLAASGRSPTVMCSACKRVHLHGREWMPVEVFLLDHHRLLVSHGLCDLCVQELYPDTKL